MERGRARIYPPAADRRLKSTPATENAAKNGKSHQNRKNNQEKTLTNKKRYDRICSIYEHIGALAQLGAHNTGSVGVRGSNPLRSTKTRAVMQSMTALVLIEPYIQNPSRIAERQLRHACATTKEMPRTKKRARLGSESPRNHDGHAKHGCSCFGGSFHSEPLA